MPEGGSVMNQDNKHGDVQASSSAQPPGSVVIETIDTDLVLIGLLLIWQQFQEVGRAGCMAQSPPCFLYFTNRFTWDMRSLFHSLHKTAESPRAQEGDSQLL